MQLPKLDHETILLAFAVVTGLALLFQTFLLVLITVSVSKAARSLKREAESLRTSVMPVIYDTRDMMANTQVILVSMQDFISGAQGVLARLSPKIESVSGDLAVITQGLRIQTAEMQLTAMEILERVRKQGNRLDEMCTSLLDSMDRAGGYVAQAVGAPVRQVSRMLNTVKAVVESLRSPLGPR
ncbi:MAG: hypothetical protein ABR991_08040 [Terracidiphilus sp.]